MLSPFGCAVILVSVSGCGSSEDDQERVSVIRKDSMVEEAGREDSAGWWGGSCLVNRGTGEERK